MKLEYLIFNLLIFFLAFLPKMVFFRELFKYDKKILKSIIIAAFVFIIKDIFSNNFFWKFNDDFILGIRLFGLPIEEIMFFFTVSYSTLFVYMMIEKFFNNKKIKIKPSLFKLFSVTLFLFLLVVFINHKLYFFYISSFWYLTLIFIKNQLSVNLIRFYGVIFFLTLIFNFYLTARPVVIYNENYLIGIKILTIPIEDFIYSFSFFNLLIYFLKKS